MKLIKCPFCGGSFEIVGVDEDGEIHSIDEEEGLPLYWTCGVIHDVYYNDCPIAMGAKQLIGDYEYDTIEEAVDMFNRRAGA
jgi:hypothetical protein